MVYNLLPRTARAWLDVVSVLVLAAIAIVLAYWCTHTVLQNVDSGARSNSTLGLRIAIPQAIWLTGLLWFAFVVTATGIVALLRMLTGRSSAVIAELGVATLDEEISASVDAPSRTRAEN